MEPFGGTGGHPLINLSDHCPACVSEWAWPPLTIRLAWPEGVRADYECRSCGHVWFATWNEDALDSAPVIPQYERCSAACPRCGYGESVDLGPYEYYPKFDDPLGGPPEPRVHLLICGRCGKPFDAIDMNAEVQP
jgi:hypothetical protein